MRKPQFHSKNNAHDRVHYAPHISVFQSLILCSVKLHCKTVPQNIQWRFSSKIIVQKNAIFQEAATKTIQQKRNNDHGNVARSLNHDARTKCKSNCTKRKKVLNFNGKTTF